MGTRHLNHGQSIVRHALVVTGGDVPDPRVIDHLDPHHDVICADSGFDHAHVLGLAVDVLAGDLDSVSAEGRVRAESSRTEIHRARVDKDLTDTEIALRIAVERGATSITLVTGGGGRLDHLLAVTAALAGDELASLDVLQAWIGRDHLRIVHPGKSVPIDVDVGGTVSLLPLFGAAVDVRTSGLQWNLVGETLLGNRTRGVSNVVVHDTPTVEISSGVLAIVAPNRIEGRPHRAPIGDAS